MVSGTVITNVRCSVEAKRLWNAMGKDSHNLLPKVFPELFASATLLQGDGGVGTIKQLNFTSGITSIKSSHYIYVYYLMKILC
jgi:hypothetical protein